MNNHDNLESLPIGVCLDLADQTTAAKVGRRYFCDQDFGEKGEKFAGPATRGPRFPLLSRADSRAARGSGIHG
jgi:hypothetical protein